MGEFRSQSLMVSSQLPVRNVFLLTTFQLTQYTCKLQRHQRSSFTLFASYGISKGVKHA